MLLSGFALATALWVLPGTCETPAWLQAPTLDDPVLDIALLAPRELLVLGTHTISTYERRGARLQRRASRALPEPLRPVRLAAGILAPSEEGGSAWVLTNQSERALLLRTETLDVYESATVIPWPGVSGGLSYLFGTNQLVGIVPRLPEGPFLAISPGHTPAALDVRGRLLSEQSTEYSEALHLGAPMASLGPGRILTSDSTALDETPLGETPPSDALIAVDITAAPRVIGRCPVPGAIRAVATLLSPGEGPDQVIVVTEVNATLRWGALSLTR